MGPAALERRTGVRWRRSIRTQGLVALVVAAGTMLAYLGVALWSTQENTRAEAILSSSQAVTAAAVQVQADTTSAESNAEGYISIGYNSSLTLYQTALARLPEDLASLQAATQGVAGIQGAVGNIERAVTGLRTDLATLVDPRSNQGQLNQAFSQTGADDGVILHWVTVIRSTAAANAAGQQGAVTRTNHVLVVLGSTAVALVLLGGLVLSLLFTSRVVQRVRRLGQMTDALARGRPIRTGIGGSDELARLGERIIDADGLLHKREQERDRARAELEDLLTTSPVVSFRYDASERALVYASPNVDRLLGVSADQVLGDFDDLIAHLHPDDTRSLMFSLERILRDPVRRGSDRMERVLRIKQNPASEEWREADAVFTLEISEDGLLVSLVAYLVDVTDRHRAERAAEERRNLLESIFDASPDTITVRDVEGRVLLASRNLASLIGVEEELSHEELLAAAEDHGRIPAEEKAKLTAMLDRCLAGEPSPEAVITVGADRTGEAPVFETRARPVIDRHGRVTGTVTVSREVTERVRLEHSLRRASTEAERASEAKSEFLSRMSHELRTPLNAILGFAQLLELDELPPEQSSSIDQIQRAGRHLLALINEVLDISRIEAGRFSLSPEPVSVDEVLQEVSSLLAPVAEAEGVRMEVVPGPEGRFARADRQRLLQILLNLGSNAVKYNHRNGSVRFRTTVGEGGQIRFEVTDTGPGIPLDQQDQLFIPFSRLGADRSGIEGTGVGLALSKHLVELMGGEIGVDSAPGRGSTFWIDLLPAAAPEPAGEALVGSPAGNGAGTPGANGHSETRMVILHVEDNPSNATLVEQILARRGGIELLSATHARAGLELARAHHPDLVLLDMHLPDLPGDEFLFRLKADPELADTRVVVVSADATPGRIRRMLSLGVEEYLTKPIDVEALLKVVDRERLESGR